MTKPHASGMKEIKQAWSNSRGLIRFVFLFSVFVNLLMLTGPLFMLQVYDRVLGSGSEATLVALFLLVAALYALMAFLDYARGRALARAGARFQSKLDLLVFRASMLEAKSTDGRTAPARGLREMETIQQLTSSPALLALCDIPWTPLFIALIFIFHPLLGWLAVFGGGLLILTTLLNNRLSREKTLEAQISSGAAQGFADIVRGEADLVASQGMLDQVSNRWFRLRKDALDRNLNSADRTGIFTSFTKSFRLFLQSAMLALGAYLVLQGQLSAGAMIAGSILLGRALAPVEQAIGHWPLVQKSIAARQKLIEQLGEMPAEHVTAGLPNPVAKLELKGVTVFAPTKQDPILRGINLNLNPGEALGIIGRSGAGKSSLAKVILGVSLPRSGEVILDGAHISQYSESEIGQTIGYLPQSTILFPATIMENIARMEEEPDHEAVQLAAKRAGAHHLITSLPDGYMTQLGRNDGILSGGQVQRIGLARALYTDPSILVLDEPNSALDAEGTEALNACIRAFKEKGRAVILMTHRPMAIAECDRLVVIDKGQVMAEGPRDKVLASMVKNSDQVQKLVTKEQVS